MIKQYAAINWDEDVKCFCSGRYTINDKVYIEFPTVRQIMFEIGEKNYWSTLFLLISTPSDIIAQLDDLGLDWEKVSDFDIFIRHFIFMSDEQIKIFLPTISKNSFKLFENKNTQEIILYDDENDIVIDRLIADKISDYLRYAHGIKKNVIKAGNAYTHKDLIEDAHDELKKQQRKQKHHKSQMKAYISYLSNVYKCLPDMILDMRVNYFFDAIKRTNAINEATTLPFMMYYGMVDGSNKQNQKRLDPMRYDV